MARKKKNDLFSEVENSPINEARRAVLDKALSDIVKRYGEGSIMRMGEAKHLNVEASKNYRNFWSRIIRKNNLMLTFGCGNPKNGRDDCLCRHGTCS